jgi:acetyl esterase/lipase
MSAAHLYWRAVRAYLSGHCNTPLPSPDGAAVMSPPPLRSAKTAATTIDPPAPAWRDEAVPVEGGEPVGVRVYGCGERCATTPLVLHFHAGAFTAGSLEGGAPVAQVLAASGATVVSVDYPLAPDHPFPQPAEAGHAVLAWAARQRRHFAAPRARMYVAGEEAGGNLAAAVAMMARDRGGPEIAGQILLSPMLDVCTATHSQRRAQSVPDECPWASGWRAYLARACDALHPYAAPGQSLRLAGLPSTLLITAPDDPLRDETRAYAQRLRSAGVSVRIEELPAPTGWPRSYLQSGTASALWTGALRERIAPFLTEPASTVITTTTPSRELP